MLGLCTVNGCTGSETALDRLGRFLRRRRRRNLSTKPPDFIGDHDRTPGAAMPLDAGGEVGGQPVDVVLFGVDEHEAAANPDADFERFADLAGRDCSRQ